MRHFCMEIFQFKLCCMEFMLLFKLKWCFMQTTFLFLYGNPSRHWNTRKISMKILNVKKVKFTWNDLNERLEQLEKTCINIRRNLRFLALECMSHASFCLRLKEANVPVQLNETWMPPFENKSCIYYESRDSRGSFPIHLDEFSTLKMK
jgi:hypothetical protein